MNQLIKNRNIQAFSCYQTNIPEKIILYQKKIFDLFNMNLTQELTSLNHPSYLDNKINSIDFDIIVFFDIDAIPLKPNLYEYIIDQLSDDNSLIGIEQAANHIVPHKIYAGPACFAISKLAFEKLRRPSFMYNHRADVAGEFTFAAEEIGVNIKLFNITSSLTNNWKCGNKQFGSGTIYDNWVYHQFNPRNSKENPEQQFVDRCNETIKNYTSS